MGDPRNRKCSFRKLENVQFSFFRIQFGFNKNLRVLSFNLQSKVLSQGEMVSKCPAVRLSVLIFDLRGAQGKHSFSLTVVDKP